VQPTDHPVRSVFVLGGGHGNHMEGTSWFPSTASRAGRDSRAGYRPMKARTSRLLWVVMAVLAIAAAGGASLTGA